MGLITIVVLKKQLSACPAVKESNVWVYVMYIKNHVLKNERNYMITIIIR